MLVDRAIYGDGLRVATAPDLAGMAQTCRNGTGIAWIGLYRPTHEEFAEVARDFGLHELAVEDAVHAHQRAKLEHYGDTLFCVLHRRERRQVAPRRGARGRTRGGVTAAALSRQAGSLTTQGSQHGPDLDVPPDSP